MEIASQVVGKISVEDPGPVVPSLKKSEEVSCKLARVVVTGGVFVQSSAKKFLRTNHVQLC